MQVVDQALRIQLEGNLELVEALLAQWQLAARTLAADSLLESVSWHGLPEADAEAAHAVAQVEARAGGAEVLTQLASAREAVVTAVLTHTAALGLVTHRSDARSLLIDLRATQPIERVQVAVLVPRSRLVTRQGFSLAATLAILVGLFQTAQSAWERVVITGLLAIDLLAFWWMLKRLPQPTTRRVETLLVAHQALRLADHHFEKLTNASWHRTATGATVRFEFTHRHHELKFDKVPATLLETLRAHGVSISEVHPLDP